MSLSQLFLLSKKIHRWSLLVTVLLTLIMGSTGMLLKYPNLGEIVNIDLGLIRYIHREMSVLFSVALIIMATTGLAMYFIPELLNKARQSNSK